MTLRRKLKLKTNLAAWYVLPFTFLFMENVGSFIQTGLETLTTVKPIPAHVQ